MSTSILSGLIWLQTVFRGYQQTAKDVTGVVRDPLTISKTIAQIYQCQPVAFISLLKCISAKIAYSEQFPKDVHQAI